MRNSILIYLVAFIFNSCTNPKVEIGDCYYYQDKEKFNFILISNVIKDNKRSIINLTPVFSSTENELINGSIIRGNIPGSIDSNIIWTSSIQIEYESFQKIVKNLKFHKKIDLTKKIRTATGMAADDMIQLMFIDKLIRNSDEDKIRLELLKVPS